MRVCLFRHSREPRKDNRGGLPGPLRPGGTSPARPGEQGADNGPGYDHVAGLSRLSRPAAVATRSQPRSAPARRQAARGGDVGVLQRFERRIEEMVNRRSPGPSRPRSSRSRSPAPSSASATTGPRSSPAAAPWCPTPSPSRSASTTTSGSASTPRRSARSSPRWSASTPTEQRYAFIGPVTVDFERDDELPTGRFQVRSAAVAGATADRAGHRRRRRPAAAPAVPWVEVGSDDVRPAPGPSPGSAGAPTPTCASTTPASRATTPSCAGRAAT